jgi:hypothetical protein
MRAFRCRRCEVVAARLYQIAHIHQTDKCVASIASRNAISFQTLSCTPNPRRTLCAPCVMGCWRLLLSLSLRPLLLNFASKRRSAACEWERTATVTTTVRATKAPRAMANGHMTADAARSSSAVMMARSEEFVAAISHCRSPRDGGHKPPSPKEGLGARDSAGLLLWRTLVAIQKCQRRRIRAVSERPMREPEAP